MNISAYNFEFVLLCTGLDSTTYMYFLITSILLIYTLTEYLDAHCLLVKCVESLLERDCETCNEFINTHLVNSFAFSQVTKPHSM